VLGDNGKSYVDFSIYNIILVLNSNAGSLINRF